MVDDVGSIVVCQGIIYPNRHAQSVQHKLFVVAFVMNIL